MNGLLFLTSLGSAALVWPLALILGLLLWGERVRLVRVACWWGALAAIAGDARWGRRLGGACGLVLGVAVAVSRVALKAHPASEALAGVLLGLPVACVGLAALEARRPRMGRPALLAGVVLAAVLAVLGRWVPYVPSEVWFQRAGVALSGRDRPVDRQRWQARTAAVPMPAQGMADRGRRIQ